MESAIVTASAVLFKGSLSVGEASANVTSALLGLLLKKGVLTEEEVRDDFINRIKDVSLRVLNDETQSEETKTSEKLTLIQLRNIANNLGLLNDELLAEIMSAVEH